MLCAVLEESQLTTRGRSDQREYAPAEDEDALRRGGRLAPAPDDFPDVGGGHPLVDLDDDNSIPMDLDSDTESVGPGCTLQDDSMRGDHKEFYIVLLGEVGEENFHF